VALAVQDKTLAQARWQELFRLNASRKTARPAAIWW
jgi:hypothetical protein